MVACSPFFFAMAYKWRSLTGGDDGMSLKRPDLYLPGFGTIAMNKIINVYYLIMVVVIICLFIQWYISKTAFGNSVRAVKENDERAGFIGYNTYLTKVTLFATCAFFAGIAGSLFAFFQQFVATSSIDAAMSMQAVFMTFMGGVGSFFGPILGAGVYLYFTDWVSRITDRWEFVLGVLFILLVLYARTGLAGFLAVDRIKRALSLKGSGDQ
jgi:branched-chain amino acid transport system permease protein